MQLALAVTMTLIMAAQGTAPGKAPASDEAAIRAIVAEYLQARERRDATAVGALFTADADQLTSSGDWRRGREAIVKGTLASSEQSSGRRTIAIETVRFPARDSAIADGRYELAGAEQGTRRMWTSFLFVRQDGRWRIAAIRNMLPAPPAAPAPK